MESIELKDISGSTAEMERIDIYNNKSLRFWARNFNIQEEDLIETVYRVGDKVEDIREYLGK